MFFTDGTSATTTDLTVPGTKTLSVWRRRRSLSKSSRLMVLLIASAFSKETAELMGVTLPIAVLKRQLADLLRYFQK